MMRRVVVWPVEVVWGRGAATLVKGAFEKLGAQDGEKEENHDEERHRLGQGWDGVGERSDQSFH